MKTKLTNEQNNGKKRQQSIYTGWVTAPVGVGDPTLTLDVFL